MHLTQVDIENIRSIEHFHWEVAPEHAAGWHVLLGVNGSGKSTVLQSIALALIGERGSGALRQDWNSWLRRDAEEASAELILQPDPQHDPSLDAPVSTFQTRI